MASRNIEEIKIFHRRAAESAKEGSIMFTVDPPKIPADRKDGKHKDKSASRDEQFDHITGQI